MPGNSRTVRLVATALPGPAKRLTILADSFRLTGYDETALVVPTIEDAFGNLIEGAAVSWDVADPAVVTVDLAGQMRAAKPGSTLVRASIPEASDSVRVIVDPSGAISITFDDGWLTTYTQAFPVLEEFQLRANVAVITGAVGWDAYLTLPHLQALDSAGWSVVSHTVNHTRLPTLSDSALDEELRESQKWISENGFSGGQVFVVPYLDWGPRERQAIAKYYRAARGTSATYFWPDSLVRWVPPDPFELTALEADARCSSTRSRRIGFQPFGKLPRSWRSSATACCPSTSCTGNPALSGNRHASVLQATPPKYGFSIRNRGGKASVWAKSPPWTDPALPSPNRLVSAT
jgi:peptidoglycan/xylan/chitin deacetylase (PgdA/CDA1 family)